jgi:hypothetical protein
MERPEQTLAEVHTQDDIESAEMPHIEATTGRKGWAGEVSMKEETMRDGNISNVSHPYAGFDFECLMYVPEAFADKVARLEKWPIPWLYNKAAPYYKQVPHAINRLSELMGVAYNIAVVYVGPKHLWKQKEALLEKYPYTTLICVSTPADFHEQVTFNEQILSYYTLSAFKAQNAGKKGILFTDWSTLGQKIL